MHPEFTEPVGGNILSIGKGVITSEVIQERMVPTDELEFIRLEEVANVWFGRACLSLADKTTASTGPAGDL